MDWNKASNEERFQEAERRIEAAHQEGAKSLDLGDLGPHELPASLGRLEELEELFLGWSYRHEDDQIG